MLKKFLKNIVVWYIAAILAVGLIAYFLVAPFLIHSLFPQYAIVKKYTNIAVCTDLAPVTPSKVFLPVSCQAIDKAKTIGCIAQGTSSYAAPSSASSDETIACPALVSANDTSGKVNPALARIPIEENTLHTLVAAILLIAAAAIYVTIRIIVDKSRHKKQSEVN